MAIDLDRLKAALADRYAVEHEIGQGGMAVVYLAEDLKHHRTVAIKVLRPELAATLGAERFLREIETAAKLNHPHILGLIDSGEADGYLYYVMPYVEGESLRQRLDRETQLPINETIDLADQIAAALDYAHDHDVVHRDIKPANILLSDEQAIVTDFGIARAISSAGRDRLTATGLAVGSPSYMSPEQAAGERLDGRSDIYSLGCIVYEMLIGDPPFAGRSQQAVIARHSAAPVPSVSAARDTVPVHIDRAVAKAMAKLPADRYRVASFFAADLASPTVAMRQRPNATVGGRRLRSPTSVLRAAFVVALLTSVVVLAWEAAPRPERSGALLSLPPYLAAWVTTMIGIWFLFEKAEETVTTHTRRGVAQWLQGVDPAGAAQSWPVSFARAFDRIFGEKHLSWKCFARSSVASLAAVIIAALAWVALRPSVAQSWLGTLMLADLLLILVLSTALNMIADYLSLLETRHVLKLMERARPLQVGALVAIDLVATAAVWFLVLLVLTAAMYLVMGFITGEWPSTGVPEGSWALKIRSVPIVLWGALRAFTQNALLSGSRDSFVQIWFFSTFVTSVWLWLYAMSGFAVKAAGYLGVGIDTLRSFLDVEAKPIRSLGYVAMLLATFVFAVGLIPRLT